MDPKFLYQLCEVIEQGSMSRAATILQVTQPTLTRNIKALEEIVGAPVLRRNRHGVTPTNIGERLAEQGRNINNAMASATATVQHWRTGLVGEVRLGVGAMMSAALLPDFLRANPLDQSNFTLRIVAADTTAIVQKLRKNELDLAIIPSYAHQAMGSLKQTVLCTDRICILAGSNSPLAKIEGVTNSKLLSTQTWISINNMARMRHLHDEVAQLLGVDGIAPKFMFDGDVTAPMELLRYSNMLTLAPHRLAQKYVDKGGMHILKLDVQLPERDIALWSTQESEADTCVSELTKIIKAYFERMELNERCFAVQTSNELSFAD